MKKLIALALLLGCGVAQAGEVTELSLPSSTCTLMERGVAVNENAIVIKGIKNESGCSAFISDEVFDDRFKFCVYSGFDMINGVAASYYGCSYSREKDSYMFRSYMSLEGLTRPPELWCKFMCYSK